MYDGKISYPEDINPFLFVGFVLKAITCNCFHQMTYLGFFVYFRYSLDDIGSGSHVHISLSENGKNVFMASDGTSRYGMSKIGEEFLAGVLNHLPSILAFTAPVPNRLQS